MNKNHITYEVILSNSNVLKEVEIYFDNDLKESLKINGGNFFYLSKETNDTTNLNFFDFCEELSNDSNCLREMALRRYKEMNIIFNDNNDFTKEKERLDFLNLFQEDDNEKATTLISKYFEIFETDRIVKKKWEDFVKYFDLNKIIPTVENVVKKGKTTLLHDGDKNYLDILNGNNSDTDISGFKKIIEKNSLFAQKHYKCSNSKEIIAIVISNIFESNPNAVIKKCRNCEKLFIPNKANTVCCARKSLDSRYKNKNCGEVYRAESKKEPAKKLYKDIYDMLYKRKERSKDYFRDEENKQLQSNFMKKAAKLRRQIKIGTITKDDYIKWLEEFKKTGVILDD